MIKATKDFFLARRNTLTSTQSVAVLIYRIYAVLLIIPFGWGKLQDFTNLSNNFFDNVIGIGNEPTLILALMVQLGCPLFMILGFQTRFFSSILALHMVVATKFHFYDPYGKFCYPLGFLGMYCILTILGPGKYSLDYKLFADNPAPLTANERTAVAITAFSMALGWMVFYCQFAPLISTLLIALVLLMWGYCFYLVNKK